MPLWSDGLTDCYVSPSQDERPISVSPINKYIFDSDYDYPNDYPDRDTSWPLRALNTRTAFSRRRRRGQKVLKCSTILHRNCLSIKEIDLRILRIGSLQDARDAILRKSTFQVFPVCISCVLGEEEAAAAEQRGKGGVSWVGSSPDKLINDQTYYPFGSLPRILLHQCSVLQCVAPRQWRLNGCFRANVALLPKLEQRYVVGFKVKMERALSRLDKGRMKMMKE